MVGAICQTRTEGDTGEEETRTTSEKTEKKKQWHKPNMPDPKKLKTASDWEKKIE